jgi:hypothetical protein
MMSASLVRSAWLLAAAFLVTLPNCAKKDEVIVKTASGKELTAADIDRDPVALLPGGAIALFHVDAKKLFASELGQKIAGMARTRLPLPESSGFEPSRDLQGAYIGSYSMQGVDVVVVLTGTFDREKIEKAAESTAQTPDGVPLVKSTYAGRTLYTAQNVGFVVLTERTVLAGNETGIRRALDRIHEARARREIPAWMSKLLSTPAVATSGGADFRSQPVSDAVRQQLRFLDGLETVRFVGNFEAPGLNLAGTLSYADAQAAEQGAANVRRLQETLQGYRFLMALFGIAQPVQKLEAQARGKDTQFVLGLDGQALSRLLDKADQLLGITAKPQTVPATLSPAVPR